jgi:pimeloyl-ACP methyl ester carboxylesterase
MQSKQSAPWISAIRSRLSLLLVLTVAIASRGQQTPQIIPVDPRALESYAGRYQASPDKAHQEWISKVPKGRHITVPNAGHEIPTEQHGFVIDAIKELVKQVEAVNGHR